MSSLYTLKEVKADAEPGPFRYLVSVYVRECV
jgi:hypothetical protein